MGFQDFIGESEACSITGVSPTTLRRFAEAGYFHVETDSGGLRLFSKSEIEKLFGTQKLRPVHHVASGSVPSGTVPSGTQTQRPVGSNTAAISVGAVSFGVGVAEPGAVPAAVAATALRSASTPLDTIPLTNASESGAQSITESRENVDLSVGAVASPGIETAAGPTTEIFNDETTTVAAAIDAATSDPTATDPVASDTTADGHTFTGREADQRVPTIEPIANFEREAIKLKNIIELQDRILTLREAEIERLREDVAWLRIRVEKLEEKSSRDQVLLLAETQTIRRLIAINDKRRGPVQTALEWLGFSQRPEVDPSTERGESIEVAAKSSARD